MRYRRKIDGAPATAVEALDARGVLRDGFAFADSHASDGEYVSFNMAFRDAAIASSAPATLRDSAGKPTRLFDATSGATLQLTDHLIAAIENEARREGMAVDRYVADVLRYSPVAPR